MKKLLRYVFGLVKKERHKRMPGKIIDLFSYRLRIDNHSSSEYPAENTIRTEAKIIPMFRHGNYTGSLTQ